MNIVTIGQHLHFGVKLTSFDPLSSIYKLCDHRQVIKFFEPQFLHLLTYKSSSLSDISQRKTNATWCHLYFKLKNKNKNQTLRNTE